MQLLLISFYILPNLVSLECSRDKSDENAADLMKSSVCKSSTFFVSPLPSWITLPAIKCSCRGSSLGLVCKLSLLSRLDSEDIWKFFELVFDVIIMWDIGSWRLTILLWIELSKGNSKVDQFYLIYTLPYIVSFITEFLAYGTQSMYNEATFFD